MHAHGVGALVALVNLCVKNTLNLCVEVPTTALISAITKDEYWHLFLQSLGVSDYLLVDCLGTSPTLLMVVKALTLHLGPQPPMCVMLVISQVALECECVLMVLMEWEWENGMETLLFVRVSG